MRLQLNYPADATYKKLTSIKDIKLKNSQIKVNEHLEIQAEPDSRFTSFKWFFGDCLGNFETTAFNVGNSYLLKQQDMEKFIRIEAVDMHGDTIRKDFFISSLPVMYIETENQTPITSKDITLNAKIQIQGNAEFQTQYDGKTEIHGRGSSSWLYYPTQQSYKLKLGKKTNLFGFGVNKHWILVSNFIDNAFVRNRYAQELAGQLGLANVQMQAVVLILNGICKGVYMLSQHIRIQPEVIDIFDWEQYAEDTGHKDTNYIWVDTDDSLSVTGGFIYEMEPNSEDVSQFVTTGGLHVVINRPEYAFTSTKMMDFAKKTHDGFEKCCQSQYFDDEAGKHYYDYADQESMAKYLLVNCVFGNIDARSRSRYIWQDNDQKMSFGPVWDFDRAFGSVENELSSLNPNFWNCFQNESQCVYQDWTSKPYICYLMRKHYWQTVRPWLQELLTSRMDADCAALSGAGSMNDIARRCNVVVHPYVGTYTLRGYDADWTYMKEYVRNHMQWMDQQLETTDSTISSFCMMYAKFPYQPAIGRLSFIVNGTECKTGPVQVPRGNVNIKATAAESTRKYAVETQLFVNGKHVQTASAMNIDFTTSFPEGDSAFINMIMKMDNGIEMHYSLHTELEFVD